MLESSSIFRRGLPLSQAVVKNQKNTVWKTRFGTFEVWRTCIAVFTRIPRYIHQSSGEGPGTFTRVPGKVPFIYQSSSEGAFGTRMAFGMCPSRVDGYASCIVTALWDAMLIRAWQLPSPCSLSSGPSGELNSDSQRLMMSEKKEVTLKTLGLDNNMLGWVSR